MEDRYRLIELLGSGGMATVHRARDQVLGRQVAIKRLLPHLAADPDAAERFRREAQAAARLNHAGIVTVYDTGSDEAGPYIIMEMIEGDTLASKIADEAPFGAPRTAAVVRTAAEALDHAHANGVVHRDVKPTNLIVDDNDEVRLTDFGIARAIGDPTLVTTSGQLVGTVAYMAPEILAGAPASPASDVYSLAAVAYEMLTGRPPFQADNVAALVSQITDQSPAAMGNHVPEEVAAAVLSGLSKDPNQRPATAGALATALVAGTTLPMQGEAAPIGSITTARRAPLSGDGEPTLILPVASRRPVPWLRVSLLLTIVLAMVLAVVALSPLTGTTPAATPSTVTTTTTAPTTTTTVATTTTLPPDSPQALALAISELLEEMRPPEYKPKETGDIAEALDKVLQEAGEGDRQELGDSLVKALEEVEKLPDGQERGELRDLFLSLAESYGFTVERRGTSDDD